MLTSAPGRNGAATGPSQEQAAGPGLPLADRRCKMRRGLFGGGASPDPRHPRSRGLSAAQTSNLRASALATRKKSTPGQAPRRRPPNRSGFPVNESIRAGPSHSACPRSPRRSPASAARPEIGRTALSIGLALSAAEGSPAASPYPEASSLPWRRHRLSSTSPEMGPRPPCRPA